MIKKNLITAFVALLLSTTLYAQNAQTSIDSKSFQKGDLFVGGLVGLQGFNGNKNLYPIYSANAEWAPTKWLGIGLDLHYKYSKDPVFYPSGKTELIPSLRLNYHFVRSKKLDVYFGVGNGVNFSNYEMRGEKRENVRYHLDFQVGARYYVSNRLAIQAEISTNLTGSVGLSYRFSKK